MAHPDSIDETRRTERSRIRRGRYAAMWDELREGEHGMTLESRGWDEAGIEGQRTRQAFALDDDGPTDHQLEAIRLYTLGELSYRQIGERMGLHFTTARELVTSAISAVGSKATPEQVRQMVREGQRARRSDALMQAWWGPKYRAVYPRTRRSGGV